MRYVVFLSRSFKSVTSIRNYLNGVKLWHLYNGCKYPDNISFNLNLVLRGLQRSCLHTKKQALPITPEILINFKKVLDLDQPFDSTLWCVCVLSFLLMARMSNILPKSVKSFNNFKHLTRQKIFSNKSGLIVVFEWAKNNQFGQRKVKIPLLAKPESPLCPLTAYTNMCSLNPGTPDSPAFLMQSKSRTVTLTVPIFTKHLRHLLEITGHSPTCYSGHSFRRGGATWAFKCGVPGELIQAHGDWHSEAYLLYLNFTIDSRLSVTDKMLQTSQKH